MAKTKNQRARKNDSLTMEQVEDLAQTIISGKESETRAEALLILVDEMERCGLSGEPICWQVKQRAAASPSMDNIVDKRGLR